jgi:uncharacterized protein
MSGQIPPSLHGQKYISLTTYRKNGDAVSTPVWFGEEGGKAYIKTIKDAGKTKRIRNNPSVKVALCDIRGKIIGPATFLANARILREDENDFARGIVNRKYWMARLSPWWRKVDYIELSFPDASGT